MTIDQYMTQQRLLSTLLLLTSVLYAYGQLADPREKFSITADIDGATNTDYYESARPGKTLCASAHQVHYPINNTIRL